VAVAAGGGHRHVLAQQSGVADGRAVVEVLALELGRVQVRELRSQQEQREREEEKEMSAC